MCESILRWDKQKDSLQRLLGVSLGAVQSESVLLAVGGAGAVQSESVLLAVGAAGAVQSESVLLAVGAAGAMETV
ncbi:hypothetical protein PCC7424_1633 [Gloeothece citriformis PCC 7424]|uniref:Uncharacterized protein n=1 Tax=Gloeothece citriformis (strain PCC 7424) TaxID=65393 RepID=B7KAW1_GLOC7|nr:hypothetical protein PCC7424_1633 [Gloeothece citriformis PCC 7424]